MDYWIRCRIISKFINIAEIQRKKTIFISSAKTSYDSNLIWLTTTVNEVHWTWLFPFFAFFFRQRKFIIFTSTALLSQCLFIRTDCFQFNGDALVRYFKIEKTELSLSSWLPFGKHDVFPNFKWHYYYYCYYYYVHARSPIVKRFW